MLRCSCAIQFGLASSGTTSSTGLGRPGTLLRKRCGPHRCPRLASIESGVQRAHQYLCVGSQQQSGMVAGDHHRLHSPQHDAVPPVVGPAAAEHERDALSPEKNRFPLPRLRSVVPGGPAETFGEMAIPQRVRHRPASEDAQLDLQPFAHRTRALQPVKRGLFHVTEALLAQSLTVCGCRRLRGSASEGGTCRKTRGAEPLRPSAFSCCAISKATTPPPE